VAPGLGALLVTFVFAGIAIGMIVGVIAAWFSFPPVRSFAVALLLAAGAGMTQDLSALDFESSLAAIILAPLIAVLPVGAGFVVGYRFTLRGRAGR
jgi:hypothetical protein